MPDRKAGTTAPTPPADPHAKRIPGPPALPRVPGQGPEGAVSRHGTFVGPVAVAFAAAGAAGSLLADIGFARLPHAPVLTVGHIALWALLAAALAGAFGLYLGQLSKAALGPISHAAALWKAGGLRYRIPPQGNDELGDLANSLNALAAHHETEVRALRRLAEERAELSRDAARAAVLEERQRLARELHDAVSQAVFSIAMMSAAARRLLPDRPEEAARELEAVAQTAQSAQREMRALLLELRPVELSGRPLTDGLRAFLGEVKTRHGIEVAFSATGVETHLPPAIEDGLFRIAQEAVANAVRHARATRLQVALEGDAHRVRLVITDDGHGFDPSKDAPDGHFGLQSMRERCAEMGGHLRVESQPGGANGGSGTTLWAEVPLRPASARPAVDP